MRVFLEILLLAVFIAFGAAYGPILWRRMRERKRGPPPIPEVGRDALRLAVHDERLREAVELRGKIADLAQKPEVGLDAVVVTEVDGLLEAMVGLLDMKRDLGAHLASISEERIARDAALVDAESIASQRRQIEVLRARERSLEAELARAVTGLRETWLGLLDALAQPGSGAVASGRIRAQLETLRIRIQAEREAREDA